MDEVLAVGDVRFQKKCLGTMNDVARKGRTVILVSHNMGAITQLCGRCVLLEGGRITAAGHTEGVVAQYLAQSGSARVAASLEYDRKPGCDAVLTDCWIADEGGEPVASVDVRNAWQVGIRVWVRHRPRGIDIGVRIHYSNEMALFTSNLTQSVDGENAQLEMGENVFYVPIPGHFLAPGIYGVSGCSSAKR